MTFTIPEGVRRVVADTFAEDEAARYRKEADEKLKRLQDTPMVQLGPDEPLPFDKLSRPDWMKKGGYDTPDLEQPSNPTEAIVPQEGDPLFNRFEQDRTYASLGASPALTQRDLEGDPQGDMGFAVNGTGGPENGPLSEATIIDLKKRQEQRAAAGVRSALVQQPGSPDEAAKDLELSKELGVNRGEVSANRKSYEFSKTARDIDSLKQTAPKLRTWLDTARENLEVAHDDTQNLSWWETAGSMLDPGSLTLDEVGAAFKTGAVEGSQQQFFGAAEMGIGINRMFDWIPGVKSLNDAGEAEAKKQRQIAALNAMRNMPKGDTTLERGIYGAFQSAPASIEAMAVTLITKSPFVGAGAMGVGTAGQAFGEAEDAGKPFWDSFRYALEQGTIETATEMVPLKFLIGDLAKDAPLGKIFFHNALSEGIGEQAATFLQDASTWLELHPDKTVNEFFAERPNAAMETLVASTLMTGMQTTLAAGVKQSGVMLEEQAQQRRAEYVAKTIEAIKDHGLNDKLAERLPDKYRELVASVTKDGPKENIRVTGEGMNELAQSANLTPEQLAQAFRIDPNEMITATEAGEDIVIPSGNYAAAIRNAKKELGVSGETIHAALAPNMRLRADDFTAKEREAMKAVFEEEQKARTEAGASEQSFADSADRVRATIREQVSSLKIFNSEAANTQAAIIGEMVTTLAERTGQDPETLWKEQGFDLVAALSGEQADTDLAQSMARQPVPIDDIELGWASQDLEPRQFEAWKAAREGLSNEQIADRINEIEPDAVVTADNVKVFLSKARELGYDAQKTSWNDRGLAPETERVINLKAREVGNKTIAESVYPERDIEKARKQVGVLVNRHKGLIEERRQQLTGSAVLAQPKRGTFTPRVGRSVVRLFESSNLSTLVHEAAHWYLDTLWRMASIPAESTMAPRPAATARGVLSAEEVAFLLNPEESRAHPFVLEQIAAILEWQGKSPSWTAMFDDQGNFTAEGRDIQEAFAESFEAYLRDGKAPTTALRSVFASFKAWLLRIYKSITQIGSRVRLNDEIRQVFDRMLATDEAIAAVTATSARDSETMAKALLEKGVITPKQFEKTKTRLQAAREKAEAELMARLMEDYERSQKAWWNDEERQIRREVQSEIDERPEQRAYAWLTGQGWRDTRADRTEDAATMAEAMAALEQYDEVLQFSRYYEPDANDENLKALRERMLNEGVDPVVMLFKAPNGRIIAFQGSSAGYSHDLAREIMGLGDLRLQHGIYDPRKGLSGMQGVDWYATTGTLDTLPKQASEELAQFAPKNAQGAPLHSLLRATVMDIAGESKEDIWRQTGWATTKHGDWVWEIPGEPRFNFNPEQLAQRGRLDQMIDWPELFEAMPRLREVYLVASVGATRGRFETAEPVKFQNGDERIVPIIYASGPVAKGNTLMEVVRHEIQHIIQVYSGFASTGAGAAVELYRGTKIFEDTKAKFRAMEQQLLARMGDSQAILFEPLSEQQVDEAVALEVYLRNHGEWQARDVEWRSRMTPEWRWANPPGTIVEGTHEDVNESVTWATLDDLRAAGQVQRPGDAGSSSAARTVWSAEGDQASAVEGARKPDAQDNGGGTGTDSLAQRVATTERAAEVQRVLAYFNANPEAAYNVSMAAIMAATDASARGVDEARRQFRREVSPQQAVRMDAIAAGEQLVREFVSSRPDAFQTMRAGEIARAVGVPVEAVQRVKSGGAGYRSLGQEVGLDLSVAARMQRAKEQGFDVTRVLYHGTANGGFDEFDPYSNSKHGLFGQGVYLTDNPEIASTYTNKGAAAMERRGREPNKAVYPVYVRLKNPIDMDATANIDAWRRALREYSDIDIHEGMTNEEVYRLLEDAIADEGLPMYEGAEIAQDILRSMGHDGVVHVGGGRVDGDGTKHNVTVVFDPENIRGKFAAFDPAASGSSKILAQSVAPSRQLDALGFYSAAQEAAQLIPDNIWNMGWQAARNALVKGRDGITPKRSEIDYLGLDAMFGDTNLKGAELKAAVQEHIAAKRLVLVERFNRFDPKNPGQQEKEASPHWAFRVVSDDGIIPEGWSDEHRANFKPFEPGTVIRIYSEVRAQEMTDGINVREGVKLEPMGMVVPKYMADLYPEEVGIRRGPGDLRLNDKAPVFEWRALLPPGSPGSDTESHWSRAPSNDKGVLVSSRGEERQDSSGNSTLFSGEIQSDLAQRALAARNRRTPDAPVMFDRDGLWFVLEDNEWQNPGFGGWRVFQSEEAAQKHAEQIQRRIDDILRTKAWDVALIDDTSQWTNVALRAMVYRAARDGFGSASFATSETSTRIQKNDSAAGHYDTNVKGALEKLARQVGGEVRKGAVWVDAAKKFSVIDPATNDVRVFKTRREATAYVNENPGKQLDLRRGHMVSAYILDITPEMRVRILSQGFPLFHGGDGSTDRTAPPPDLPPMRLNLQAVKDEYGEDALSSLPPEVVAYSASATDLDQFVQLAVDVHKTLLKKRPKSLWKFLSTRRVIGHGNDKIAYVGIRDEGGELLKIIGEKKAAPGLIANPDKDAKNVRSYTIEHAANAAWEAGYFHGESPPNPAEFLDALRADFDGQAPLYSRDDMETVQAIRDAERWEQWFDENGIDITGDPYFGLRDQIANVLSGQQEYAISPDDAAPFFKMPDGNALLQGLKEGAKRNQLIREETRRRMVERHGDIFRDGTLAEEAKVFAQNEIQQRQMEIELDALARATGQQAASNLAKQQAIENLRSKQVREVLNFNQWLILERRWAKKAVEAAAKGDMAKAAEYARYRLVNSHMFTEGRKLAEKIESTRTHLLDYGSKTKQQRLYHAGKDYAEQMNGLLSDYQFRNETKKAESKRQARSLWLQKQMSGLDPFAAYSDPTKTPTEQMAEAAAAIDKSKTLTDLAEGVDAQNYKSLTVEELMGVRSEADMIWRLATLKDRLIREGERRRITLAAEDIAAEIETNQPKRLPREPVESDTLPAKTKRGVLKYFAMHRQLQSLARQFAGGKDGGQFWSYIVRPLNEAFARLAVLRKQMGTDLEKLFSAYSKAERARFFKERIHFDQLGVSLTKQGRLAVALNWGNEKNRQRLMDSTGWDQAGIQAVLDTLTQKDWDFAQSVWDYLETWFPEANKVHEAVHGVPMDKVAPLAVATKFGGYRGGYYPIMFDPELSSKAGQRAVEAEVKGAVPRVGDRTQPGFGKKRVEGKVTLPLRLSVIDVVSKHLDQVATSIATEEAFFDAGRLLKRKEVEDAIVQHHGRQIYNTIINTIVTAKFGLEGASGILNHLRNGATVVGLGWKVATAALQPLGITNSVVRVGGLWVLRGYAAMGIDAGAGAGNLLSATLVQRRVEWATSRSDFMKNRRQQQSPELSALRASMRKGVTPRWVTDNLFALMANVQFYAVDVPTWYAGYFKAVSAGMNEADAIAEADQAVIDAQGGGEIHQTAAIQTGAGTRYAAALRLLTNFLSYMITTYNLATQRVRNADSIPKVAALSFDMILLLAIPVAGKMALDAWTKGGGGDDDDDLWEKYGREQAAFLMSPFVGFSQIAGASRGDDAYSYRGPAGLGIFAEATNAAKAAAELDFDASFWRPANKTAGMIFHYPASQLDATIRGSLALWNGETTNPAAIFFGPPPKN